MFRSCSVQRSIVVNIECLHTPQLLFVTIIVILVVFDINIIIILVITTTIIIILVIINNFINVIIINNPMFIDNFNVITTRQRPF